MALTTTSQSPLLGLLSHLTTAIHDLEAQFSAKTLSIPSLDAPYNVKDPAEILLSTPEAKDVIDIITASCQQISATVNAVLQVTGCSAAVTAEVPIVMRALVNGNVPEIIREFGGADGLPTQEIATRNGMSASKLARLLRFLASHHIFRETSPNVFAHNRHSSALDTQRSLADIENLPATSIKFEASYPLPAMCDVWADLVMHGLTSLPDVLLDPRAALSEEPHDTAWARACGTNKGYFEWLELPENDLRRQRFGAAMGAINLGVNPRVGFDWSSLTEGAVVVDLGGGVGSAILSLIDTVPQAKFIVQDLPGPVAAGQKFWSEKNPEAMTSGRVTFREIDLFKEDPIKADLYFLRHVLHNWSDKYAIEILKRIRHSALPDAKLLVMECVVDYVCGGAPQNVPGANAPSFSAPLLPNGGASKLGLYGMDILMMSLLNSQERTIDEWVSLIDASGWKLTQVHRAPKLCQLIAEIKR